LNKSRANGEIRQNPICPNYGMLSKLGIPYKSKKNGKEEDNNFYISSKNLIALSLISNPTFMTL
jgi:hypothetical protein